MQEINKLTKIESLNNDLKKNFQEAAKDANFCKLVSKLKVPSKEIIKYTSKLEGTCQELENCKNCKGLFCCKNSLEGHISAPKVIENRIYFTYVPCKYYKQIENRDTNESNLQKVRMKDIETNDKKQYENKGHNNSPKNLVIFFT